MTQTICSLALFMSGFIAMAAEPPKPMNVKEPALQKELIDRTKTDQDARQNMIRWMSENGTNGVVLTGKLSKEKKAEFEKVTTQVKKIDRENTEWLKGIVAKHGWPTNSLVGTKGAQAAWLLVQHADAEPKFQRQCLDLMTDLPKEEISQSNLAYLTDRVLLAEGKKQLYGTQFTWVDGKLKPRPLEDEENVDKRRAKVGLQSLAEYVKLIEQQYGKKPKK